MKTYTRYGEKWRKDLKSDNTDSKGDKNQPRTSLLALEVWEEGTWWWFEAGEVSGPPCQGDTHAPAPRELLCGTILHFRVEAQTSQDPPGFGLCSCCPGSPQFLINLGARGHMSEDCRNPQVLVCVPCAISSTFSSLSAAVSSPCSS